jgi:hypothetical protein
MATDLPAQVADGNILKERLAQFAKLGVSSLENCCWK